MKRRAHQSVKASKDIEAGHAVNGEPTVCYDHQAEESGHQHVELADFVRKIRRYYTSGEAYAIDYDDENCRRREF